MRFLFHPHLGAMTAVFLVTACLPAAAADREPPKKSPFAHGEKLPGDLSEFLDADGDGKVTDAEAQKAAADFSKQANAKTKTDRGQAILDALDKDANGKVEIAEAQEAVARDRIAAGGGGKRVAEIFEKLDKNADGFVTQQEYGALISQLGLLGELLKPRLVQMFFTVDANRDGAISVVESQMVADHIARQAQLKADKEAARAAAPDPKIVQMVRITLSKLDRNRNGQVSQGEAKRDRQLTSVFAEVDTNLDKNLSAEEMYNFLKLKASEKEER